MRPVFSFLIFSVGIALGGLTVWRFPSLFAADSGRPRPAPAAAPANVQLATWDWHASATPPPLADAAARAAIAAWVGLRGPDGKPADFATRAHALHALLAYLPNEAYPRLLSALLPHSGADDRDLLGIVFNLYAEHDPAGAARWALAAPEGDNFSPRWQATLAVQSWAARDASAASAWVRSLGDPGLMRDLAALLLAELAKTDPISALQAYGPQLWDKGQGFYAMTEPLANWAKRDPAAALAWLVAQPIRSGSDHQRSWWIRQITAPDQAPAMMKAIAAHPGFPGQGKSLDAVLTVWAGAQPTEALAWVQALPDIQRRIKLLGQLSFANNKSPASSLSFALALPTGGNREHHLGELIANWAAKDPSAALAWIGTQDDPGVRAAAPKAQAAILGTIARDEPATAVAEWQALTDPKTKTAALGPIIEAWSQKDPGAALRWLQTQSLDPSDGMTVHYVRQALYPWSLKEPEAALRWAEAQPQQKAYYLKALSGDWNNKADRATVSDLYTKITDPALRTEVLTAHVREWLTKDRPAAQTWLESNSTLTAEQAAALLATPLSTPAR